MVGKVRDVERIGFRSSISLFLVTRCKCRTERFFFSIWVAESNVSTYAADAIDFDAEKYALAEGLAGLQFGAEGGAVEEAGSLDGLLGVGSGAAGESEEGGVRGGAVEAGHEWEGECVDVGVEADGAEGEEA